MINNVEIIVARFNEDLNWTLHLPFCRFQYIVYNKGNNENFNKTHVKKIINVENIGKCDHTYLYHITKNFNNLPNIIVFFPGSLNLDYKKNKAALILNNIIESNFSNAYFAGEYNENIKKMFYNFTLDKYKTADKKNLLLNSETKLQKCKIRPYGNWYSYFFGNTTAHWYTMWGIFSVDKRDIIQHPIERYQSLLQTVSFHSNPEAGHYIERSWGVIFYPLIYTNKISLKNSTKKKAPKILAV